MRLFNNKSGCKNMFYQKCGANNLEKAKFCSKCGNAVTQKVLKKKTSHKISALAVFLVIFIGACGGLFALRKDISSFCFGNGNKDVYSKVDDKINDLFSDSEFNKMDIHVQKSEVQKLLKKMEKKGIVLKGSIEYDDESEIFWYKYSNNAESGILMGEYDEDFAGNAQTNEYVSWKSNGLVDSTKDEINFDSPNYPYSKKQIEDLELKALYMYGWSDENDVKNGNAVCYDDYLENQKTWNLNGLKTNIDSYCTVEDFKTELIGYDLIIICEHGNFQKKYPLICLKEKVSKDNFSAYKEDFESGKILTVQPNGSNEKYWWIKPSFFEKYYSDNKLQDSIVWISSCHGYQSDELVEAFSNCGAKSVIGYNNSVLINYDFYLHSAFVYSLMHGDSVQNALKFSQFIWKNTDTDFYIEYNGTRSKYGTFINKKTFDNVANYAQAKIKPGGESFRLINEERVKNTSVIAKTTAVKTTTTTAIKTTTTKERFTSIVDKICYLDECPIISSDRYTGNEGDSFVYPIGSHEYSRGNVCIDNTSYEHGLEGWIARWNYKNESSWAYSVFNLDSQYKSLSGKCKLIKSYNTEDFNTTLEFWNDETLIQKYKLTPDTIPFDINLDVTDCNNLKIYFYDNESKSGGTSFGLVDMKLSSSSNASLNTYESSDAHSIPYISDISASSQLSSQIYDEETYNYSAQNIIDNDITTCWSEGADGNGIGESITLSFNKTYEISELCLWNGLCTSEDLYYKNSRPRKITVVLSDGNSYDFECSDGWDNRKNTFSFNNETKTSSMTIIIKSVYEGNKYQDTCISEISVS